VKSLQDRMICLVYVQIYKRRNKTIITSKRTNKLQEVIKEKKRKRKAGKKNNKTWCCVDAPLVGV